jgi:2-hydroxychromene-2-carboxylate isomerase
MEVISARYGADVTEGAAAVEHNDDTGEAGDADADAVDRIEFFFDPMCPWAYQTSLWIREVRRLTGLRIEWRFFSLEEINRPEGKRHPWERPIAYGWTPMRVAALLRRDDMAMCDAWYAACGQALHREARRPYEEDVARELLAAIGAPADTWDRALADPTTHDEVHADHCEAVEHHGGFGVPIIVLPDDRAVFGPVVVPAPLGDDALDLWRLTLTYARFPGLFELKTPKTSAHQLAIADAFTPYLAGRQWETIQKPAP